MEQNKKVAEALFPTSPLTPLLSETSIELKKRRHEKHNRNEKIKEEKLRKHKHRHEG